MNKPDLSNGDLYVAYYDWLYNDTGGTVCASDDISTSVICATKRDETRRQEVEELRRIVDNWDALKNETPSDVLMNSFFIEMFDLTDLLKSKAKVYNNGGGYVPKSKR